jgi:hypothetical protein
MFDTWETIIAGLDGSIKAKRAATTSKVKWKKIEQFYDEATSDLRSIKECMAQSHNAFPTHIR